MRTLRLILIVALVVVAAGLALHYFGGAVVGWMGTMHGRPAAH